MSTTSHRWAARLRILSLAGLACWALQEQAMAQSSSYSSSKTVFWSFGDAIAIPQGPGQYRYLTHAFADDAHGPADHNDNPQTGPAYGSLTEKLARDGNINGDQAVPANNRAKPGNHKWTLPINFDQRINNQTFGVFGEFALSKFPHADSFGNVSIDYQNDLGFPGLQIAKTVINVDGMAKIINLPLHSPETAYAEAKSAAYVALTGKVTKGSVKNGKDKPRRLKIKGDGSVTAEGFASAVSSPGTPGGAAPVGAYSDPITLAYYDEMTGALVAESTLFTLNYAAIGAASVAFSDAMGLRLESDSHSTATFGIDTPSAWVLNGISGTASIVDGHFVATGDLAGLAWDTHTRGDLTFASLSPASLDFDFTFEVKASGLGSPTNDLVAVFGNEAEGIANAYATTVPEPSTLLLLGAGVAVLLARRRGFAQPR